MADQDPAALEGLERWAAEIRAREAAEARVRERWLRTQAQEDARLVQVLAGLAEQRVEAVVTTTAGHQVAGRLTAVGTDFVALRSGRQGGHGRTTFVPLHALAWARPAGRRRGGQSYVTLGPDSVPGEGRTTAGSGAAPPWSTCWPTPAAHRPRLALRAHGAVLTGELRSTGVDFVAVETSGEPSGLTYVQLQSVSEISLFASG